MRSELSTDTEADRGDLTVVTGTLEVRLARDERDVYAAQKLRYRVFYEEMSARPTAAMAAAGRDFDQFDPLCDHMLVIDHARPPDDAVVGTYRVHRQEVAERNGGFYSAGEYDLSALLTRGETLGGLLELGRSCVHPDYRTNATIHLLWRCIANFVREHKITTMFGCASLPGRDPAELALPLSYLYHNHLAPPALMARALPDLRSEMNLMPAEQIPLRKALHALPPLIKAYLRLGGFVGDGAVVDHQFGTTDVFMVVPLENVKSRYFSHYDRDGEIAAQRDAMVS